MVSADNVNLDVLELIFTHLAGNDLVSTALVSRSFFAGVIPRLYCTLLFRLSHAKHYPAVMSPFAAIAAHPEFAIHVRNVDIRTVPVVKSQYNPRFLVECARALELCRNITSFRCSINALPPFIPALEHKDRLRDLRIYANLTTEQSTKLVRLASIRHLTLDFPSWNIMNLLPTWATRLQVCLTSLTLYMANELNETVLDSALAELPSLLGLHIIGCAKVDHLAVLRLVNHTPLLESLSMTTGEPNRVLPQPPAPLAFLRHLALDARLTPHPHPLPPLLHPPTTGSVSVLSAILTYLSASGPQLESFAVKYPDRQLPVAPTILAQLSAAHGASLKSLAFIDCSVGTDPLAALCRTCVQLERLELSIPFRDLITFAPALAKSRTLRTLVDVPSQGHHGPVGSLHATLAPDSARHLLAAVPSLKTIAAGGRVWTVRCLSFICFVYQFALSCDLKTFFRNPCLLRCLSSPHFFYFFFISRTLLPAHITLADIHPQRRTDAHGALLAGFERRPNHTAAVHWFMPRL
ncbi:hypothetical protein C8R43DRAFT_1243302 [Mycena crocata]|nr:hypothetical protein C8R43DRAFT_1243302 [Mycena crocata]